MLVGQETRKEIKMNDVSNSEVVETKKEDNIIPSDDVISRNEVKDLILDLLKKYRGFLFTPREIQKNLNLNFTPIMILRKLYKEHLVVCKEIPGLSFSRSYVYRIREKYDLEDIFTEPRRISTFSVSEAIILYFGQLDKGVAKTANEVHSDFQHYRAMTADLHHLKSMGFLYAEKVKVGNSGKKVFEYTLTPLGYELYSKLKERVSEGELYQILRVTKKGGVVSSLVEIKMPVSSSEEVVSVMEGDSTENQKTILDDKALSVSTEEPLNQRDDSSITLSIELSTDGDSFSEFVFPWDNEQREGFLKKLNSTIHSKQLEADNLIRDISELSKEKLLLEHSIKLEKVAEQVNSLNREKEQLLETIAKLKGDVPGNNQKQGSLFNQENIVVGGKSKSK